MCAVASAETVRIVRVHDGDSLLVTGERGDEAIRLVGVQAPETSRRIQGRWVFVGECYALDAARALRAVAQGKNARLTRTGKDSYGRTLGYLFISPAVATEPGTGNAESPLIFGSLRDLHSQSVNRWLIKNGYAKAYRRFHHRYERSYLTAEAEAKAGKRGLWLHCE